MALVRLRRLLRRFVPFEARLRFAVTACAVRDRVARTHFAKTRAAAGFEHVVCTYQRPFIDYPGQEAAGEAKRRNQALLAAMLDGVVIAPGEVFSVWKLAGRPDARKGYLPAAALKDRELTMEVGGAVCLLSTVLYNVGLLGGLAIVERHCHSIDQYGDARYFELGRDAAIEYGYLDLRLRNTHAYPVCLGIDVDAGGIVASLTSEAPADFRVEIEVDEPVVQPPPVQVAMGGGAGAGQVVREGTPGLEVTAVRRIIRASGVTQERLPRSVHHAVPALVSAAGSPTAVAEHTR